MDASRWVELRELITRHVLADGVPQRLLPNVTLGRNIAPTPPFAYVAEPLFALVAQGVKHIGVGNEVFDYGAGQYLIVSVDLPLEGHVIKATANAPFLGLGFTLRPESIAALLLEANVASPSPHSAPPGIAVNDITQELLDSVIRLLKLLDRPADIPVLGPAIEREIIWRLINGQQGTMVRQIGLADSRMSQIGRAIRRIRSHYAHTLRIEELAGIAGMSVTSFHRHFRTVTSMTPVQYQKQIRLQTARSQLMSTAQDVAEAGFAVGYHSPSQFSREYRRLFGQPPGKDGERLRQSDVNK